ncbi:FHA domain-containing protein [Geothrix fuzhouensis]|uniref:FHA domain-containing protein n=1 Tax=Geothrix fuzhouensis TaxID=2966451 RepID=UPI002147EF87|nr:FHA domain-containing protein [Geothrix fuzhouensis]
MIVVCPACQARFQYDDSRFGQARAKRFKCPKCAHLFEVANPAVTALPPAQAAPVPLTMPLTMPVPMPEQDPASESTMASAFTTARRDRDSILVAAGLQGAGLPAGFKFSLAFLTGPQASTVQVLERPLIVIGREEGDVITQDPETSRRHAVLEIRGDGTVWITDQESTNGTQVNGERITGPVQLLSQQEFICGNSTFMLLIRNTNEYPLH